MIPTDVTFSARVGRMRFGRAGMSRYGWHVDEVDGLSVGEVQEVGVAEYNGTGQYDLDNVIRDPRIITISGHAVARSMAELGTLEDLARGCLVTVGAADTFEWSEYGRTRYCEVRRYRGWRFQRIGSTGVAEFTARFRAPSQLIYGRIQEKGPGTSVLLRNEGTYPAFPVFEITGDMPSGYRIVADGRSYVVRQGLAPGSVHRVDMRTGVLHLNGVPQVGAVSAPRKLTGPPGNTTFSLLPDAGAGTLRMFYRDTYL